MKIILKPKIEKYINKRTQDEGERTRERVEVQEQGQTFRWSVTRGECEERKSTGAVFDLHTLAFKQDQTKQERDNRNMTIGPASYYTPTHQQGWFVGVLMIVEMQTLACHFQVLDEICGADTCYFSSMYWLLTSML